MAELYRQQNFQTENFVQQTFSQPAKGLSNFSQSGPPPKPKSSKPRFGAKPQVSKSQPPMYDRAAASPTSSGFKKSRETSNIDRAEAQAQAASDEEMRKAWEQKQNKQRQQRGLSYGRLNPEAQERIKSVRLMAAEGGLKPIQVSKASAKALRMMGVSEAEVSRPYAAPVEERMRKLAQQGTGGVYSTNFGTAALGNQIIAGFEQRKQKLQKRAEKRRAEKDIRENKKKVEAIKVQETLKRKKKKAQPEPRPGQSKLAAFLEFSGNQEEESDEFEIDMESAHDEDENPFDY